MTNKYKAKNGLDFTVPGVGNSVNGILETDQDLSEAPSLELVHEQEPPVQSTTPTAQPEAIIGVAPQATAPIAVTPPAPTNNTEVTQ